MRLGNSASSLIHIAMRGSALVVLLFASCSFKAAPVYRSDAAGSAAGLPMVERDAFLSELSLYHGVPYREGGSSLSGVDCSGLVRAVYTALGVRVRRTVLEQYGQGVAIGRGGVRTGDLVFFGRSGLPTHVGIAVSGDQMLHSSSSRGVVLEDIDQFSKHTRLVGVRRVANLR
jgi:cell wall-associated NlpC family hydrolase